MCARARMRIHMRVFNQCVSFTVVKTNKKIDALACDIIQSPILPSNLISKDKCT